MATLSSHNIYNVTKTQLAASHRKMRLHPARASGKEHSNGCNISVIMCHHRIWQPLQMVGSKTWSHVGEHIVWFVKHASKTITQCSKTS